MPTSRSLISELLQFARGAPASAGRDALVSKVQTFQRAQRTKRIPPPRKENLGPDRLQGVVAAIAYLLLHNKTISSDEFFSAIQTRNTTLQQ